MDIRTEIRSRLTIAGILIFFLLQFGFWFIKETSKDLFFGKVSEKLVRFSESWGITETAMVEWLSGSFSFLVSAGLAFFLVWMSYRLGREKVLAETKPKANHPEAVTQRHYSDDDRDHISKAFRSLRMTLTNEADPLQMNVQRLRQSWSQKAGRNLHPKDFGEQIDIESTIDQIASIRADAARLGNAVFDNFLKDNIGYEPLLRLVLDYRRPDPFRDLMHHADRLKLALEAANNAYQAAPERAHDFSQIVSSLFVHFEETNSKLNGWIAETTKRIDEQEKLLLSGG